MTYTVPERVYRTADGRLTRGGDPEAAFLAFTKGQELADAEAKRLGVLAFFEKKTRPAAGQQEKVRAAEPENKADTPSENKSGVSYPARNRRG